MSHTYDLIRIIGSPFVEEAPAADQETLERIYDQAFADRVALLYLNIHRKEGWSSFLEEKYHTLRARREKTLDVIADLGTT